MTYLLVCNKGASLIVKSIGSAVDERAAGPCVVDFSLSCVVQDESSLLVILTRGRSIFTLHL